MSGIEWYENASDAPGSSDAPDYHADGTVDFVCPCGCLKVYGQPKSPFLLGMNPTCPGCGRRVEITWEAS